MDAHAQSGFIIWITGMNGVGKSALARFVRDRLALGDRRVELIDADDPGEILTRGLGATKDDRDTAVRRVARAATMVARSGGVAVVAALSPYREAREALRREARRFVEVFVDCPMDVLQQRDPIYKKALAGEAKNVPGVDDPYEPPTRPDLTVKSDQEPVAAAAARLFQALVDVKYLGPAEYGRITGGQKPKRARPAPAPARRKLRAKTAARKAPKVAARTAKAGRKARR
jgi:adenylyl-sulfate kinase